MNTDAPRPRPRGWLWTLFKCALLMAASAALGAVALSWLIYNVSPPWFVPRFVYEWVMEVIAPYAAWIGGALGALAGFLASLGVVAFDASRGRLSKLR